MLSLNNHLKPFFDLLPVDLKEYAHVAGGAAVNFDKAEDVDIWILTPKFLDFGEKYLQDLQNNTFLRAWDLELKNKGFIGGLQGIKKRDLYEEGVTQGEGYKNAVVLFDGVYDLKKFQVIASKRSDVRELMGDFDLSVHQAAVGSDGRLTTLSSTTKPGAPIYITNFSTPNHTFARLRKLVLRYGGRASAIQLMQLVETADITPEATGGNQ